MNEQDIYLQSINELKGISEESEYLLEEITSNDTIIISESRLDGWDYCYALLIGIAGAIITSSQKLEDYLADIHKAASDCNGEYDMFQTLVGKLLYHKGDYIDKMDMVFKNRNGENAYGLFHRLFWGHDVLSIKEDNPFILMFRQKGISGIVQAVRHLLADTLSKQGLPMPGSSFLDFVNEEGKTSNYLVKISQMLSDAAFDNKTRAQEIYSHMFTIKGQDFTYAGFVDVLSILYFKMRSIVDPVRRSEIRLISFSISFWGKAIIGMTKQNGIPYISIPLGKAMILERVHFECLVRKKIKKLHNKTEEICKRVEYLEEQGVFINEMIGDDYSDLDKQTGRIVNISKFSDLINGGQNNG